MKILRIDDAIHEQLKREARAEGRTLQWWVENKLTQHGEAVTYTATGYIAPKNIVTASSEAIQESENKPYELPPLGRMRSEIQADMRELEANYREEAALCQDGETAIKIEKQYNKDLEALEKELAEVTI